MVLVADAAWTGFPVVLAVVEKAAVAHLAAAILAGILTVDAEVAALATACTQADVPALAAA